MVSVQSVGLTSSPDDAILAWAAANMSASLFLADENVPSAIVDGARRYTPPVDIARVHDVGLRQAPDEVILAWAAEHNRVLLTRYVGTMQQRVSARLARGDRVPGVVIVTERLSIGEAIEAIALLANASLTGEGEGRSVHLST